jgi:monofunctional biosynthetic peptidoglycan transglycosylase
MKFLNSRQGSVAPPMCEQFYSDSISSAYFSLNTIMMKVKDTIKAKILRFNVAIHWSLRLLIVLGCLEVGFILGLMPDWQEFRDGPIQKSRLIRDYEFNKFLNQELPDLRWTPVKLTRIPKYLLRTVVVAEDSRFYQHEGVDTEAIKRAFEYNWSKGRIVYGGSTISQQTIKNLFLSNSRNPLRKLHELILTYMMEYNVGKKRILEIYLNIAELGKGLYGVEAASHHYFQKPVEDLTLNESIELAATLPSPVKHNPNTRTEQFLRRAEKIRRHLQL